MKMREAVNRMCEMEEGSTEGFCNTENGTRTIDFDREDLEMKADENNVREFASKYGMGQTLFETVNTMKKMQGSKGIFHP